MNWFKKDSKTILCSITIFNPILNPHYLMKRKIQLMNPIFSTKYIVTTIAVTIKHMSNQDEKKFDVNSIDPLDKNQVDPITHQSLNYF